MLNTHDYKGTGNLQTTTCRTEEGVHTFCLQYFPFTLQRQKASTERALDSSFIVIRQN